MLQIPASELSVSVLVPLCHWQNPGLQQTDKRLERDGYEPVLKHSRWCLLKQEENGEAGGEVVGVASVQLAVGTQSPDAGGLPAVLGVLLPGLCGLLAQPGVYHGGFCAAVIRSGRPASGSGPQMSPVFLCASSYDALILFLPATRSPMFWIAFELGPKELRNRLGNSDRLRDVLWVKVI